MRRLLRIILWMVKGLMLLIALAALVMWPVSRGKWMGASAQRYTMGPAWGERWAYDAGCWDGQFVFGRDWQYASGVLNLAWLRSQVRTGGEGWRYERWWFATTWDEGYWPSRRGLLRWDVSNRQYPEDIFVRRWFAAPLGLVALVSGVWPLTSITFALRRRIKNRRVRREGLCKHCGYDLRATPAAGGELLAVCPECGKATDAGNKPSPPRLETGD